MIENRNSEIITLISDFVAAVTNMRLYPPNHPLVLTALDHIYNHVLNIFEYMPELTLFLIDDEIIAFEKPLTNAGMAGEAFVKILSDKGIERITFLKGLPRSELHRLISDLASGSRKSITADNHVKLGKVVIGGVLEESEQLPVEEPPDLQSFKIKAAAELKKMYLEIRGNRVTNIEKAKEIVSEFIKIYDHSVSPLEILAPIRSDDEYTYVHITNVALLTICFADYLGFSGKILQDIGVAALLHDVGKMFIPDKILSKPGILTAEERLVMETHTLKGAQYIGYYSSLPKLTIITALEHHIKYDGSGYPLITRNWETNITSQMVCIADVYDALRSKRPYQDPRPYDQIKIIFESGRGSTYNPVLIDNFLTMIEQKNHASLH